MSAVTLSGDEVWQGPTLTNPQALHTLADLRSELQRANDALVDASLREQTLRSLLRQMASAISPIVLAHMSRDAPRLADALEAFVQQHVKLAEPGGGRVQ